MREGEAAQARAPSVSRRGRSSPKSNVPFVERRRVPRPKLAEIRRGASLNLLPPSVIAGSVRFIEFLLVVVLGFAIYLGYVEREGMHSHIIYLMAVLIAATATILTFQAFNLYEIPAFSAFVRSFTRIFFAWSMVVVGMMALAFFGKVGADFSRVWIATWYAAALSMLFAERLALFERLSKPMRYIGCDIASNVVAYNNERFRGPNVEFRQLDITRDELPAGDVVTVREVLQHLSNDAIIRALNNLRKRFKVAIITECVADGIGLPNLDMDSGRWTRDHRQSSVYVDLPPFNLPVLEELRVVHLGKIYRTTLVSLRDV